ncbi:FtsW/RodA/SpoVE family cell cycle protein [Tessaracoccus flavus]|jgi:cell division protein FtsW (lipid II flippase)|uniref:Cell division protein n=1 Tax=Tessaracoccus flavus TaxID=1610493 RepID=A0A1Q2CHF8_9ACTN|nr:FtsW/RodA/SpoVE family cell cycle protein [Tessaracoccus flavus]AQP45558.1 cell division protein [Tessaracoccus flavus]SDY79073.1 cell elongation-specific peptidoglycan biosynthesis regulator RodA [Tessaracoccus flavus]
MSAAVQPAVSAEVIVFRQRRNVELVLIAFAQLFGFVGWVLTHLNLYDVLPENLTTVAAIWFGLGLAAHLVVRFRLPYADPVILPSVFLLNGLGLAMIYRIDQIPEPPRTDASTQLLWTALGLGLFSAVVIVLRDHRRLQRYPYLLFIGGLTLLLLPLIPGLGVTSGGAQIWIRLFGFSFQPAEVAKILLAVAFAAYLYEHREVLALAGRRVLGIELPRARDLGPILVMWLASLAVMVFQNDLGTSLLFFGLFTVMIYIATERPAWPILASILFVGAALAANAFTNHVPRRVNAWLDPFSNYDANLQIISAQFGYAWGGLFGRGWGLGRPGLTPLAKSDMIAAAVGEELGILGLMAVILVYALLVARGFKTALISPDGFGKLLAAGLSFSFALQVFSIIGGVTRLLPLTGLTTPFMSQGGSSLIANWMIIGILLVISHRARVPQAATAAPQSPQQIDDLTVVIAR